MADVIFYAPFNEELRIGADKIQKETRDNSGRLITPAASIKFASGFYRATTKIEADVIQDTPEFRNKRVVIVTEEDLTRLMSEKAQKIGSTAGAIKVTAPEETGYKMPADKHEVIVK
jgi:hypothetical protein